MMFSETTLSQILLEDFMPSSSPQCAQGNLSPSEGVFNFTFSFSPSLSYWDGTSVPYEEEAFLAELHHEDSNPNRTWTIRVGPSGNLNSIVGAFGEAVPPQHHSGAPWIDEVWQTVAVNLAKNNNPSPYFVHQAGTYMRDGEHTTRPFYSPTIAAHCSGRQCMFGSWGQQAHVPTPFKSDLHYFTRVRDCGDGVLEYTMVIHNTADENDPDADYIDYLNTPWGGVRTSTLRDLVLSYSDGTEAQEHPMKMWGSSGEKILSLSQTAGYTTFAEDLKLPDGMIAYELPCSDVQNCPTLTVKSCCNQNGSWTNRLGEFGVSLMSMLYFSRLNLTHMITYIALAWLKPKGKLTVHLIVESIETIASGCRGCNLFLRNTRTGEFVHSSDVLHWAWAGNQVVFAVEDETMDSLRLKFLGGDQLIIEYADFGKRDEDNLALTLGAIRFFVIVVWAIPLDV